MPKGTVNIEVFKDRLRLAWSWQGKRFWLYIGLPDSRINRKAAEIKARMIELDIASNNFDPSLTKYKPQKQESISVTELFDRFIDYKKRTISIGGFAKYQGLQKHVSVFFGNKNAIAVTETVSENFRDYLAQKLEPVTVRERIVLMNACWEWGQKKKLVTENPWAEVKISVAPKQRPQPFTIAEITAIVHKFRCDPNLTNYADYVEFKFGVGLRTGEAAALTWRHCSAGCDRIWIGESLSNGARKSTKTNKARTVPLTSRLQQLLLNRRTNDCLPDDLIFTSTNGLAIDSKNFCNRYWKPALAELGIDYRRPYTTRHTLISHGLEAGMNPVAIAALTGHNIRTLYENYAGLVNPPQLPDLGID
ncbi:MAG: tyrosine-type recombinase/integrase [Tychonema bourrellyi B0820]|nr:tyrosine-type recombinase/integrase [Tychonema bourrellyi B0820]PJE45187.1 MAG: site-specific integrase [Flavobacterium sp.] [Flavobacterium sp. FEMGT703F]